LRSFLDDSTALQVTAVTTPRQLDSLGLVFLVFPSSRWADGPAEQTRRAEKNAERYDVNQCLDGVCGEEERVGDVLAVFPLAVETV
jgi:hypothetical protein